MYLPNRLLGVHFLGVNLGDLKYLFFGLALVVLMIFRPQGPVPGASATAGLREVRAQVVGRGRRQQGGSMTEPMMTRGWPPCTATSVWPRVKVCSDHDLTVKFGGLTALDAVSFAIKRGEILGLIGPNGAGKDHLLQRDHRGVHKPSSGSVTFDGAPLGRIKRHQITRRGIARTFQNIRLWGEMTALENVIVGTDARHRTSVPGR